MNRTSFLKTLLGGFGAALVAPKILAEVKPEPPKFTNSFEDLKNIKFPEAKYPLSGTYVRSFYYPPTQEYKHKI